MNSVPEWVLECSLYAHRSWRDNTKQQFRSRRLVHNLCYEVIHRFVPFHDLQVLSWHNGTRPLVESSKAAWAVAWNVAQSLVNPKRAELMTKATVSLMND